MEILNLTSVARVDLKVVENNNLCAPNRPNIYFILRMVGWKFPNLKKKKHAWKVEVNKAWK